MIGGRSQIALLNGAANLPAATGTPSKINVTEKFSVFRSELKSVINIPQVVGAAGYLTITLVGPYAVGDQVRVTVTSNLTSRQLFRKTYTHTVVAGGTSVTAIALALSLLMAADIGVDSPFASVVPVAGVLTITQQDDDKRGLVGYVYTDSAAGTITNVPTATVISEGQPSDLVDAGIPAGDITAANYSTLRITFHHEVPIPFVDSQGITAKEIIWFGTVAQAGALAALIP